MSVETLPRLVVGPDRRGLLLRVVAATLLGTGGLALGLGGLRGERPLAAVGGFALVLFFWIAGAAAVGALIRSRPHLVMDRAGLLVEDRQGTLRRLPWERLRSVSCARRARRKGLLLGLRREEEVDGPPPTLFVPEDRLGGAPAPWVAGMIETFRARPELRERLAPEAEAASPLP